MKKTYVKPEMKGEVFIANEYVATCYVLWCTVPTNTKVYHEKNGKDGYQEGQDELIFINNQSMGCGQIKKVYAKGLPDGLEKYSSMLEDPLKTLAGDVCYEVQENVGQPALYFKDPKTGIEHAYIGGPSPKKSQNNNASI